MQVTDKYLNRFGETFDDEALFALEPRELPLNSYFLKLPKTAQVATDIPEEDPYASQIDIVYDDANAEGDDPWDFTFDRAKAKTLVIPVRDGNDVENRVGYEFDGLMKPADLRRWCRVAWGYSADVEAPAPQLMSGPPPVLLPPEPTASEDD